MTQIKKKISAGSARLGGPLCIYDEDGNAIAKFSEYLLNKEEIALAIVNAVNVQGGIGPCYRASSEPCDETIKQTKS